MRKIALLFFVAMMIGISSCDDSGATGTRAGIIAEDFVKEKVLSADDLDYSVQGVEETEYGEYHVVANVKTLNGLGLKVPRKVSIRLMYNGEGDWTETNNWTLMSIEALNESTGEVEEWY